MKKLKIVFKIIVAVLTLLGVYKLGSLNIKTTIPINSPVYRVTADKAIINNGTLTLYGALTNVVTGDSVTFASQSVVKVGE
jgi:hypothetical protein